MQGRKDKFLRNEYIDLFHNFVIAGRDVNAPLEQAVAAMAGFRAIDLEPQSKTTSVKRRQLNEGLVLEILISDRHPLPFVLALIEGGRTDIFPERVFVESEDERNCE